MKSNIDVESVAGLSDELNQLQELIRKKAYDNFEKRGGGPGLELDDWLIAESELLLSAPVDVQETDGQLVIGFAIADLDAGSIRVKVNSENLLLQGGDLDRSRFRFLHLPEAIVPDQTRAEYQDGVLRITAPAAERIHSLQQAKSA